MTAFLLYLKGLRITQAEERGRCPAGGRIRGICSKTVLGLFLFLCALPGEASFEFTEIGPRSAAMGGAGVSRNPHVTGMFYNPAHLADMTRSEAFTSYENLYMGLTDGSRITRQVIAVGLGVRKGARWGRIGIAMHELSLAGFYSERTIAVGYGRGKGRFKWGVNVRRMSVTYGSDDFTELNPVLKAGNTASAMGLDAGILYRNAEATRQIGFSLIHANSPDVGIKHSNPVDRGVNLGVSMLRATWNWHNQVLQTGSDLRFKSGFERMLTKKMVMRAGFNLGSRDYRNFSMGFGYKGTRVHVDYAMILPMSGIPGIMGHHQVGLTWRFGPEGGKSAAEKAEEGDAGAALISTASQRGTVPAIVLEMARKDADALVEEAVVLIEDGDYEEALKTLHKANELPIEDPRYQLMEGRASAVVRMAPDTDRDDERGRLVRRGAEALMLGDGKTAIESLLYASQKWPDVDELRDMRDLAMEQYPAQGSAIKPIEGLTLVDQKLEEALSLIYDGQYTAAVKLCEEVLELETNNVLALVRQGSAYYALGRRETAQAVWKRALELDPGNKDVQQFLNRKEGAPVRPAAAPARSAAPKTPPVPVAAPKAGPAPSAAPKTKPVPAKKASAEVQAQYKEQKEYYERLQRMGVNKDMLKLVLQRMIRRFEGTGVDMTFLRDEEKKY